MLDRARVGTYPWLRLLFGAAFCTTVSAEVGAQPKATTPAVAQPASKAVTPLAAKATAIAPAALQTVTASTPAALISPIFQRKLNDGPQTLRGFADLHTHPMSHLGFGGKLIHGAPDVGVLMPSGAIYNPAGVGMSGSTCNEAPQRAASIQEALGTCYSSHAGHDLLKNKCGNHVRRLVLNGFEDGNHTNKPHSVDHPQGAPAFSAWPKYNDILHQQMYVDWLKRAYEGGMRVMVGLAVNNYTLTVGLESNNPATRNPFMDKASADLQIDELRRFVEKHTWMEVARSPEDLRRIVGADRLAVIIGVEVDDLGDFVARFKPARGAPPASAVRAEIQRLYGLGVRYIFPVHVTDNHFGGTAVYEDEFNRANCVQFGSWWNLACAASGEQITHKVNAGWDVFKAFKLGDCGGTAPLTACSTGHKNSRSLTDLGKAALDEMMRQGMIVDIDHASQATVKGIFDHTRRFDYPLVSGHNGLRSSDGNENMRTRADYQEIARRSGLSGVGFGKGRKIGDDNYEVATARDWLARLREVIATGVPVAFGSDINGLVKMPAPRAECKNDQCVRYDASFPKAEMGTRTWNYNTEGVAHVGLFPDLLRDVEQLGGRTEVEKLYDGAEAVAKTWEKAKAQSRRVPAAAPKMTITRALYGRNCNISVETADIKDWVAAQCENQSGCIYRFTWNPWGGDPNPSLCGKEIDIAYTCADGRNRSTKVPHTQTPQDVKLDCK